jgi:predicted O-methyltransferase YrrM
MTFEDCLKIDGWMDEDEMQWLYEQAQRMEIIVEIGSWLGRSTSALCLGCKGTVYSIDHFKGSVEHQDTIKDKAFVIDVIQSDLKVKNDLFEQNKANLSEFTNLVTLKMTSANAALDRTIPEKIDMVFIDGSKDYESIMLDLKLWFPRTKILCCGHDITQEGIPDALTDFIGFIPEASVNSIWGVWI